MKARARAAVSPQRQSPLWGRPRTHGHRLRGKSSRELNAWNAMHARCENPNSDRYARYGGRGIRVCRRWRKFENFLMDMGLAPSRRHWIGRKDNDGDYKPSNCRWETPQEQSNQRSNNRWVTFRGERRTVAEWSRAVGLSYCALQSRLDRGWPLDLALDPQAKRRTKKPPKPKRAKRRLRCAWCRRPFWTRHTHGRFCGPVCNKSYQRHASYWRHRERISAQRRARRKRAS